MLLLRVPATPACRRHSRLFLLEVGDGWNDPAAEGIASPIHRLAEIEHKDLSLPMTLTDGWVWEDEEDERAA